MNVDTGARFKPVTHCIFDFDGTLVNSEVCFTDATNRVTQKYGKDFTWYLKAKTIGLHFGASAPIIIKELDLPLTKEEYVADVLIEFEKRLAQGVDFMPGAERLILHLHKHNIPIALCTGSTSYTFSMKMKSFGVFFEPGKYFHHIVKAGDDPEVENNKPAPDAYNVCISRFDEVPSPDAVLVFEDSPTGVESAIKAGLQCVMTPDPRIDKSTQKATLILDSLLDFKPELFNLPKFED